MAMSNIVSRLMYLAVAAVWLTSSICNARDNVLLMSPERIAEKFTFAPLEDLFNTANVRRIRYKNFINNVREDIVSGDKVHGIPRLHNPASLPNADRYLQVALFNSYEERIFLAIDKATVDIVGYRTGYKAFFFTDTNGPDTSSVFPGFTRYLLPFSSRYLAMEEIVGSRRNISLGMSELDKCIKHLHDYKEDSSLARCMLITIQMVSEAIRYRYVEKLVVEHISETNESFLPTAAMISFEENWKEVSARIQESVGGVIYPPFVLPDASNQNVTITSITPTLGRNIAVLDFVCDSCTNIPEPTVHIIGSDGLCVDVPFRLDYDEIPPIMWPCKSTNDANQLWTLMKDGTIRSKGKCLTAYRVETAQYVVIYNCTTKPKYSGYKWEIEQYSGNKWEIEDNGNIINKESKLALTKDTGYIWSSLTVAHKSYSSNQGWSLSNSTNPVVTPIIGYKGMCVQVSDKNSVQMSSCSDKSVQQWAIYPDGTVRPSKLTTHCLVSKSSADGKIVVHALCDGGNAERWLFNHDLTISDATNENVLEVKEDQTIAIVKRSADMPITKQIFDIKFV